jgi:DNA primase
MDPDEFLRAYGPEAFESVLGRAVSFFEMLVVKSAAGKDLGTPDGKAAFAAELHSAIDTIRHPIVRKTYRAEADARLAQIGIRLDVKDRQGGRDSLSAEREHVKRQLGGRWQRGRWP